MFCSPLLRQRASQHYEEISNETPNGKMLHKRARGTAEESAALCVTTFVYLSQSTTLRVFLCVWVSQSVSLCLCLSLCLSVSPREIKTSRFDLMLVL